MSMQPEEIRKALTNIGLALHACHNTVTTDLVDVEPSDTSWRIDNSKEITLLEKLEAELLLSTNNAL